MWAACRLSERRRSATHRKHSDSYLRAIVTLYSILLVVEKQRAVYVSLPPNPWSVSRRLDALLLLFLINDMSDECDITRGPAP